MLVEVQLEPLMNKERYTADSIQESVYARQEELFEPYARGRPDHWKCDTTTRDLVCIGNWITSELIALGCNDADRRTQQMKYHREMRSSYNLWQTAAEVMNEVLDGTVEQNRIPHRKWG
jgi:hypothetical protein